MSLDNLPEPWLTTKLVDVCEIILGQSPEGTSVNQDKQGIVFYQGKTEFGKLHPKPRNYCTAPKKIAEKNDILLSVRAPVGPTNVANETTAIGRGLAAIRAPLDMSFSYVLYYFKYLEPWLSQQGTGTTFKAISGEFIRNLDFIVPAKAEQKEIVRQLDVMLAQVEQIKARLDAIPAILKKFRQSVLADAVSGKLTEEWRGKNLNIKSINILLDEIRTQRHQLIQQKKLKKSMELNNNSIEPLFDLPALWKWSNFEECADNTNHALKAGPFGSALKKSDCKESGYKVYGQEHVIAQNENLNTYFIDDLKYQQLKNCAVSKGDILISLVGTIGKVLILSDDCLEGIINPRLVKLSLNQNISRIYIKYYLESVFAKDFFKSFSHGGTMEILNLGILKQLPIPLPPIAEQLEIEYQVENLFNKVDLIEQTVQSAQKRVNLLTQSILAKAFSGELTAEWREQHQDLITGVNSAESLLAKIQAEWEASKPVKKTRAKKAK